MLNNPARAELSRDFKKIGFFTLAFGAMIGVGWVTALSGWLEQAGPLGTAIAFAIGGAIMVCIGLCYAELTPALPLTGGEVAYAYKAYGTFKAFLVGWALAVGYISISGFEAISIGRVLSFMFPGIDRWPLYHVMASTVYGTHLLLAVGCTLAITAIHWFGTALVARLQVWLTLAFVAVALIFLLAGFGGGSVANLQPLLPPGSTSTVIGGILAVLVTVPFWFVGFDIIPQSAEEASHSVRPRQLAGLILWSIVAATAFYILLVFAVSFADPWQEIVGTDLPAARAFELAFNSSFLADAVLVAALIGLFTSWNGFFLAGSRVIFALGRAGILPRALGAADDRHHTPKNAILLTGALTLVTPLLGRDAILAIVNVGSFYISLAFLGVTLSLMKLRRDAPELHRPYTPPGGNAVPIIAATGAVAMLLAMLIPGSPAALRWPIEAGLLIGFGVLGLALWFLAHRDRDAMTENERTYQVLGKYI
ncbi:MAG: APC family permease [Steroidobacteraceae bacterium]